MLAAPFCEAPGCEWARPILLGSALKVLEADDPNIQRFNCLVDFAEVYATEAPMFQLMDLITLDHYDELPPPTTEEAANRRLYGGTRVFHLTFGPMATHGHAFAATGGLGGPLSRHPLLTRSVHAFVR